MLRKIYLSFFGYPISLFNLALGRLFRPFMLYGFWNNQTKSLKRFTRYSSNTVFLCKEKIDIADYCWIGPNCIIDGYGGVKIDKGVQIAGLTAIYSHSSHISIRFCGDRYIDFEPHERTGYIKSSVHIGEYSFMGVGAII